MDNAAPRALEIFAQAELPTQFGDFRIVAFCRGAQRIDDVALVRGNVENASNVPTRLHSECLTGDVFHSLRCDCRQQLEAAQRHFAELPQAIILYMRQEGRGIGLMEKMKAYKLQENGMDTVEANICLGHKADERDYGVGASILHELGVKKMRLLTNNPMKRVGLEGYGLEIVENVPLEVQPNEYNKFYMHTKKEKMGHNLHNVD